MDADTEDRDDGYQESVDRIKDKVRRTTLGWADFVHQTELLDKPETLELLHAIADDRDYHELALWLDDLIDTYAVNVADGQQFNPPTEFKETRPIVPPRRETMADILEDFRTGKVFGIPQDLQAHVDAARGIPVERTK